MLGKLTLEQECKIKDIALDLGQIFGQPTNSGHCARQLKIALGSKFC